MTLDLSGYKTPYGAAKATHEYLIDTFDLSESEITLKNPEEAAAYTGGSPRDGVWAVVWESGPYEWAVNLTLEVSMFSGAYPDTASNPEITGFYEASGFWVEHYFSFDMLFYPE